MHDRQWAVLMARYNQWMNHRVFEGCISLDDSQYRQDLGAFFGSIHKTLNHILVLDCLFLRFLRHEGFNAQDPETIVGATLSELYDARKAQDVELLLWSEALDDGTLDCTIAISDARCVPAYVIAAQMFNHQTHHRGQVHAMLTRLGVDIGSTDIPGMPFFTDLVDVAST